MDKLNSLLEDIFKKNSLFSATFSNPFNKDINRPSKISVRLLKSKEKFLYQISTYRNNQVFHRSLDASKCLNFFKEELLVNFKQGLLQTAESTIQLLTNRKGETTIIEKPSKKADENLEHNRRKNYLLKSDTSLPFLNKLGLADAQGKIYPQKMDKFRQINRFLEMVADILPNLPAKKLSIVDFGCGKAYLTFALYHFLTQVRGYEVQMLGVDRKEDIISFCTKLAQELELEGLTFKKGEVSNFNTDRSIDLVIALHACDTATDIALAKAIQWQSKAILAAPCCQHELYNQLKAAPLEGVLKHGILKEKMTSIVTDAVRAALLETKGYSTQLLEFIDPEHTPKNLLIRATWGNSEERRVQSKKAFLQLKELFHISPTLEKLL